jgi:hypothetical protein
LIRNLVLAPDSIARASTRLSTLFERGDACLLAQQARNFARLGMATEREFAEEQVVVDRDFKATATRR